MITYFWKTNSIFMSVFVSSLAFASLVAQYTAFNVLPFPIQEAKAINLKTPSSPPNQSLSSDDGNRTMRSSSSPPQSNTASLGCISYNPSTRTVIVSCSSPARLTDIDNKLHDSSILVRQSTNGVWFLNANLVITKGATLHINSTDTKWLKISSKVTRAGIARTTFPAYIIDVHGSLKIDSVKITSWDPTTNNYAITNGSRTGSDVFIFGAPRPVIEVDTDATTPTDITNSEIAYLGFEAGKHKADSGLSFYGGDGSILRNDNIHHLYFGLYTFGVGHMIIENSIMRNSGHYGLDPHTGTHDMIIRNNIVYDNNGSGIICSLNCYNILIENNKVHDNAENGIDFSRNMTKSIARNNIVYNEPSGIFVSQSHNNQIFNNTISKSGNGVQVGSGSSNNKIFGNTINYAIREAILLDSGSSVNTFASNKIVSNTPQGLKIVQDSTSKNNVFANNQIVTSGGISTTTPSTAPPALGNTAKHPSR
jgi:mannuronan 5-epimerase